VILFRAVVFLNTDAYRIAPPCERLRQHACGVDANTMITAQQSFLHAMLSYIADYTDVTVFTIYAIHLSCWCVNDSVCKVSLHGVGAVHTSVIDGICSGQVKSHAPPREWLRFTAHAKDIPSFFRMLHTSPLLYRCCSAWPS
jgi:hypothetical protein